ncbi:signal peptidase I [Candidatus Clostridium stratigraminis]|uniref:Signal peptidase I n=1 Tax=Candidatus Clostridium stratigraminis TaxID=3381661 RepID=A0ABW8T001_9CLOT
MESNDNIKKKPSKEKSQIRDYIISIVIAILIALTFRNYVFARADVEGESMYSTLNNKDVLFVEKLSLLTHSINKGQIIIFDSENPTHDIYVKRVIATAGDQIEVKNGKVYINNKEINEPYLNKNIITNPGPFLTENQLYTIKPGYIFVMGDNRGDSVDSRILGPIPINDVKGHVILRAYPFNTMRFF